MVGEGGARNSNRTMGDTPATPQAVMVRVHLFVEDTVFVPGPKFIRFNPGFPGEQPDPARYPGYELKLGQQGQGYYAIGEAQLEKQHVVHRMERFLFANDTVSVSAIRDKVQTRTSVDVAALTMLHWETSSGRQAPKGFFPPGVERDRLHFDLSSTAELAFVQSVSNLTLHLAGPSAVISSDARYERGQWNQHGYRDWYSNAHHGKKSIDVIVQLSSTIADVKRSAISALGLDASDLDRYGLVMSDPFFMTMGRVLADNESLLVSHLTDGFSGAPGGEIISFAWFNHIHLCMVYQ